MANPVKRKPTARGPSDSTKKAKAVGSRGRGSPKEVATYRGSDKDSNGLDVDEDGNEETVEETMSTEITGRIVTPRG